MFKLFTLEEANELIPLVDRTLGDVQSAAKDVNTLQRQLKEAKPWSIEAKNLTAEINFLVQDIYEHKASLDKLGVVVKDIETGVVDFPSQLGAEMVYLCWEKGEDAVTHYHRLSETRDDRLLIPSETVNEVSP